MMRVLAVLAVLATGCATAPPAPVTVRVVCPDPTVEPPPLYALPERRTDEIRPWQYLGERDVLEALHKGFDGEYRAYRQAVNDCNQGGEQ